MAARTLEDKAAATKWLMEQKEVLSLDRQSMLDAGWTIKNEDGTISHKDENALVIPGHEL